MRTLAQRRATVALCWKDKAFVGKKDGDIVSGFPMLIRADGLLASLAYAVEKKEDKQTRQRVPKNPGEFEIANAVLDHLNQEGILKQSKTPDDMVKELASAPDASQLRRATTEALAFLNYLKRFVA